MKTYKFPYEITLLESIDSDHYSFVLKIPKSEQMICDKPHKLKSLIESLKMTLPILIEEEKGQDSVKTRSLRKILEDLAFAQADILTMRDAYLQIISSTKPTTSITLQGEKYEAQ